MINQISLPVFFAFSLIAFTEPSRAAAPKPLACTPVASLDNEEDDCDSNGKYVDAGMACLKALQDRIKAETGTARRQLRSSQNQNIGGGRNSQENTLAGATDGYQISQATLQGLIAAAKIAKANVDSYLGNIYYPEEFDAPREVIGDPEEYLNSEQCYAEPRDLLNDMLDKIDQHIADLEKAKAASAGLESGSTQNDAGLGTQTAPRTRAGTTRGQGATRTRQAPQGQAGARGSDISGTERLQKKPVAPAKP